MSSGDPGGKASDLARCPSCQTELILGKLCPRCQVAWDLLPRRAPKDPSGTSSIGEGTPPERSREPPQVILPPQGPEPASHVITGPSSGYETERVPRRRTLLARVLRSLPPVRLVWIFLGTLIFVGGGQTSVPGAEAWALVVAFAVALDMGLQFARFRHGLRFPDAALSTAMFLVLLLQPPNAAWGSAAGDYGLVLLATTAAAVVPRHALRIAGRPWFNPTALGITVGYVLLALPISWQVGSWPAPHVPASREVEMVLVALLGVLLTFRQPRQVWLPVSFFAAALPLEGLVLGVQNGLSVAALGTVLFSPITVFFGLWMVPEPRCAPSQARWMWRYGVMVGALYVLLSALWSLGSTPLSAHQSWSSILPFVALLAANTLALAVRLRSSARSQVLGSGTRLSDFSRATGAGAARGDRAPSKRTHAVPVQAGSQ